MNLVELRKQYRVRRDQAPKDSDERRALECILLNLYKAESIQEVRELVQANQKEHAPELRETYTAFLQETRDQKAEAIQRLLDWAPRGCDILTITKVDFAEGSYIEVYSAFIFNNRIRYHYLGSSMIKAGLFEQGEYEGLSYLYVKGEQRETTVVQTLGRLLYQEERAFEHYRM